MDLERRDSLTRGMCWFHVVKNIKPRLLRVLDKQHAAEIRFDINKMQTCRSAKLFAICAENFVIKWSGPSGPISDPGTNRNPKVSIEVDEFILYFSEQWLLREPHWYEGYNYPLIACCASTNNGNESINAVVKKEDTLRELLNLNTFIHVALRMVRKWSYMVNPDNVNRHKFHLVSAIYTDPNIHLPVWTKAYNWKQSTEIFQYQIRLFLCVQTKLKVR